MAKILSRRPVACCLVTLGALAIQCSSEIDDGVRASGGAGASHAGSSSSGAGGSTSGGAGTGGTSGGSAAGAGAAGKAGVDGGAKDGGARPDGDGSTTGTGGAAGQGGSTGRGGASGGAGAAGVDGASGRGGASGGTGGTGVAGAAGSGPRSDAGSSDGGATAGCGASSWPTSKTYTITVSGTSRTYILRLPDNYDSRRPYRLIFGYHWLNGTADNVANGGGATTKPFYGLWELANGSAIFVAPQGINNGWSDTGRTNTAGGQDIAFTRALLGELEKTLCID
jgi:polyhydroxybutyrate depolymerase